MAGSRRGLAVAVVGFLMILIGLFSGIGGCHVPGGPCPSPRADEVLAFGGLVVLLLGTALLLRTGWRGHLRSSVFAAVAVVPATWFMYEIARQTGCPLLDDHEMQSACLRSLGEMTAPLLSYATGGIVLFVGLLRARRPARLT